MGHFEKGRWIVDPLDKFQESLESASHSLANSFSNVADSLIEWNRHSGRFKCGRELTIFEVLDNTLNPPHK